MSGKVSTNTQQAVINLDPRTKLYTLMVFSLVMVPSSESELDTILKIVFAGLAFLMLINIRRPGLAAVYAAAYCAAYGANGLLAYISGMSLLGIIIRLLVEVVLRMMPTLFIAMSFLQTTKVSEYMKLDPLFRKNAHYQKNHNPFRCDISLLSYGGGRVPQYSGCNENARYWS